MISKKMEQIGYKLPQAATPAANYVPYLIEDKYLYISGQLPFLNGEQMHQGKLGDDMGIEAGQEAARACMLNVLAQLEAALDGDMNRLKRCIRIGGYVNASTDFDQQAAVINGASDLLVNVLGDKGMHTRFAVGVASLPFGIAVELDAVFALNDEK
jgi:enamine deaminase RidA (YjgF/YER057c/UK114 family)